MENSVCCKQSPHPSPLSEGEGVSRQDAVPTVVGVASSRDVSSRIAVVGIGNILMSDDGVGVHAIRELQKRELQDHITCIDGGTASFDALDACGDCGDIIVVDAVRAGGAPGTAYRMTLDEWRTTRGISLHDVTLLDAISIAEAFTGRDIRVTIIGMEPDQITPGLELSQSVREKLDELVERILEEINELERVEQ